MPPTFELRNSKCRINSGWPRLSLQVWHQDGYGRQELYGYGSVFVPSAPGDHEVE